MGVITLQKVADRAGVSYGTASMALRGVGGVAKGTAARVCELAERMGYTPNAAAVALGQRRGRQKSPASLLVAYLVDRSNPELEQMAGQSFRTAGLDLKVVNVKEFASPKQAGRVLWTRGFAGVVVAFQKSPWAGGDLHAFGWERFAAIKLSRSLPELTMELVRHSPGDYMRKALEELYSRGVRRIAWLGLRTPAPADDDARLGTVLAFSARHADIHIAWRELREGDAIEPQVDSWLRAERPEVVLVHVWSMYYGLRAAGWSFPEHAGLAAVLTKGNRTPGMPLISGCENSLAELHERAALLLREQISRGTRGRSKWPREHVIEPKWQEGETLSQGRPRG